MKNYRLALLLAGALGSAFSAQAAIDINVNGVEYAIAEVSGGYQDFYQTLLNNPFYTGYYNNTPSPTSLYGLTPTAGTASTTWDGNPLTVYNNAASSFAAAYVAAGGDSSAVFAYWLSATPSGNGSPSAVEYITSLPQSVYQTPSYYSYSTTEFAVATAVPIPETSMFGMSAAGALLVIGGLHVARQVRQPSKA